jgi:hypothetical protein
VTRLVNSTHPRAAIRTELRKQLSSEAVRVAAKSIGITPQQLMTDVKGGKTVAQVATDNHKNPQDVVNALVTAIDTRIDKTKLPDDLKASLKEKVPAKVTNFVNNWHPKK